MNVSLTPELEKLVQEKVKSGRYLSASEVVREALRLLQEQDQLRELRLEELRKFVAVGIEQADRGRWPRSTSMPPWPGSEAGRPRSRKGS